MKKFTLFLFLALFCVLGQSQTLTTVDIDTLTNADTVLNNVNGRTYPLNYEVHYTVAGISGTILDTIYVQRAANGTTDWITDTATPISGLNTTWTGKLTGSCLGCTLRVKVKSTGTQSTRVKTSTIIYRQL